MELELKLEFGLKPDAILEEEEDEVEKEVEVAENEDDVAGRAEVPSAIVTENNVSFVI